MIISPITERSIKEAYKRHPWAKRTFTGAVTKLEPKMFTVSAFLVAALVASASAQSDADIKTATGNIWNAAESGFFTDSELVYDSDGPTLFTSVDSAKLNTGTYASYRALLDNYVDTTGTADSCSTTCQSERATFLDGVMSSAAMGEVLTFMGTWDTSLDTEAELRAYIEGIWFTGYSRSSGAAIDSSGFEHVFLGEIDDGECKGYHNWITTYEDEQSGDFEYSSFQDFCNPDMPKFSMEYKNYFKSVNSLMMKTSPEYDLAVFTLLFRFRQNNFFTIDCGGVDVGVQTYDQSCSYSRECVGSAYFAC